MKMKSTIKGQHSFAQIPKAEIQRSKFNRNCGLKTTFDAGLLIPVFCDEALPGDTMNLRMHNFGRLGTPLFPIMDNMVIDSFFFAVPIRLIWDNWQKFNGEQTDPGDSIDFTVPQMTETPIAESLSDYIGIPTTIAVTFNSLHHRAYNLIWNEWFRDQNLQDSVVVDKGDGPDTSANYVLKRRGKRHDYFSSCLPWPQKGDSITLPLGTTAPVIGSGDLIPQFTVDGGTHHINALGAGGKVIQANSNITNPDSFKWKNTKLETDLSTATAATINSIRQAFQIQRLVERDARGGSRYTEIIRSHFGVVSPDQRLQRPEYLGGGTQSINITPIAQQTDTAPDPLGTLAGYGVTTGSGHSFVKSFDEHCVIIGMVCLRADLTYQQGLPRMFSRQTRYDFYWPALAHLGEQAVLNKEIMYQSDPADDLVFGYQERYAEYRYKASQITGKFRSNLGFGLDAWHLAQDFAVLPVLDSTFIEENPPIDRVIAVPLEPHILFDAYFQFTHSRPMPTFSVPGMIDHF